MTGPPDGPTTAAGREGLAAIVGDPRTALAALDYDGTLSSITERPEDAAAEPGALDVVHELAARLGSVVLISGRPARQLLDLSGLTADVNAPRITVLAQYGLQRWDSDTGKLSSPDPLTGVDGARRELQQLLAEPATPKGASLEDKTQALVIHTRRTGDPVAAMDALAPRLRDIAGRAGLEPHPARHAMELRPPGFDKGGALRTIVQERRAQAVLFAGDDIGDIPAFETLAALRRQGIPGVGLVSDSAEVEGVREHADLVLAGPPGVIAFLRKLVAQLG
jgi:trehalose 6-phosphate phosphatase